MEEKLLNINEVAKYLNMSERSVKELVDKGELPAYKIGGIVLRFKKEQIDGFRRKSGAAFVESKPQALPYKKTKSHAPVNRNNPIGSGAARYTFGERLEDFLYYNDFYILSLIILILIVLAVFGF